MQVANREKIIVVDELVRRDIAGRDLTKDAVVVHFKYP